MSWHSSAACLLIDTSEFFPEVYDDDTVAAPAKHCHDCPVRRACFEEVCTTERGAEATDRHGVYAYTSPGQRESIEKRGIGRCSNCDAVRDPVDIVNGLLRCPMRCGVADHRITPPPHSGDQWSKRHTTLSKRIVGWLVDSVEPGDGVPNPTRMSDLMGGVRRSDVLRVYRALVEDGTLVQDLHTYTRGAKVATHNWKPNWSDSNPKED